MRVVGVGSPLLAGTRHGVYGQPPAGAGMSLVAGRLELRPATQGSYPVVGHSGLLMKSL